VGSFTFSGEKAYNLITERKAHHYLLSHQPFISTTTIQPGLRDIDNSALQD
jgi:hypothetical protein